MGSSAAKGLVAGFQLFPAVTNSLQILFFANLLPTQIFGEYSIWLALYAICLGVVQSVLGEGILLGRSRGNYVSEAVLLAMINCLVLLAISIYLDPLLALVSVLALPLMMWDVFRFKAVKHARRDVLVGEAIAVGSVGCILAYLLSATDYGARMLLLVWWGGMAASAIFGMLYLHRTFAKTAAAPFHSLSFWYRLLRLGPDSVLAGTPLVFILWFLSNQGQADAAGHLRLLLTFLAPLAAITIISRRILLMGQDGSLASSALLFGTVAGLTAVAVLGFVNFGALSNSIIPFAPMTLLGVLYLGIDRGLLVGSSIFAIGLRRQGRLGVLLTVRVVAITFAGYCVWLLDPRSSSTGAASLAVFSAAYGVVLVALAAIDRFRLQT